MNVCDCHVHVFEPDRFPFADDRPYTPGVATTEELSSLHRDLGVTRTVLVQPSPYGSDNSCLLDALRRLDGRGRGVAVLAGDELDSTLGAWHRAGVRGVRVNLATHGGEDCETAWRSLHTAAQRVAALGWHVQVYARLGALARISDRLATLPVPLVIDHFAMARAHFGPDQPGLAELLSLLERGIAWVKLSAPYRVSAQPDYADVAWLAKTFASANPERVVWGSDWPHTGGRARAADTRTVPEPFRQEDDRRTVRLVEEWTGEHAARVLDENAAVLYDF